MMEVPHDFSRAIKSLDQIKLWIGVSIQIKVHNVR